MLDAFFQTYIGLIALKVIFIAFVLVVMLIVVRAVNRAFDHAIDRMKQAKNTNATLLAFLRYVALSTVYFAAFSIIVSNIPALNAGINKLLAAGGVLAVVLGVAGQEALGSVASGIMILLFKPFLIGDVVNVLSTGVCGTVEDITLRHTVLKTVENKRVIIPNSTMNSATIENFDYGEKLVCLPLDVSVTYETDLNRALSVLADEVAKHPAFLDVRSDAEKAGGTPLVNVRVAELADSAIVIRAFLWGHDNASTVGMKADLMRLVKQRFDHEKIDMAYPHLVVLSK